MTATRRTVSPDPDLKWIQRRLAEHRPSVQDVRDALGWDHTQWSKLLRGKRRVHGHEVAPIARLLGVSVEEFMWRFRLIDRPPTIPLVGMIGLGGRLVRGKHSLGVIARPLGDRAREAATVTAPGALWDGAVVSWGRPLTGAETWRLLGHVVVVKMPDGEIVGRLAERIANGVCALTPLDGSAAVEIAAPKSVAPVVDIVAQPLPPLR